MEIYGETSEEKIERGKKEGKEFKYKGFLFFYRPVGYITKDYCVEVMARDKEQAERIANRLEKESGMKIIKCLTKRPKAILMNMTPEEAEEMQIKAMSGFFKKNKKDN
jgi:hypothetical protein